MRFPPRQILPFTSRWRLGHPRVWMWIVGLNVAFFVFQTTMDLLAQPGLVDRWLALSPDSVRHGYLWQFVSYMFLHGAPPVAGEEGLGWLWGRVLHLGFNMLMFCFAGRELEAMLGPRKLLGIYLGGGVIGGLLQVAMSWGLDEPMVGASAGVCAVLLAFTTMLPEIELTVLIFFILPVKMKAKFLGWAVLAISFGMAVFQPGGHVAHYAHLGGALFGWIFVRRLGYGQPMFYQRHFAQKRLQAERYERMSPAQYINEEIDPILDKISREGMQSLTRAERKILERGRDKIARKTADRR